MRRGIRRVLIGTAAAGIAVGAAVASERYAVRRARSRPDPERGEPLAERPAERLTVTSFDGTALDVRIASPSARRKGASGRPTLVFAHGFSLDMTTWHYQWKALSDRYRCVLYDQRGHGASARAGDGGYTIEALGSDLRAVLDATVPHGRAVLLGHSLGGMAILSLAERHPEEFLPGDGGTRQVAAVVLANTASGDLVKEAFGDLAVRTTAMVRRGLMSLARRPALGERLRRAAIGRSGDTAFLITLITNFAPGAPPSLVDHVARVSSSTAAEVWPPFLEDLLDLDLREAEANIRAPALVIVGDRDRLTPAGGARAMAATLPDGRLVVLQGAGHLAMLERHEEFTAAVDAFLDDVAVRASIPVGETGT